MRFSVNVSRMRTAEFVKRAKRAAGPAVVDTAEVALEAANDRVPYEEGNLARSGHVVGYPNEGRAAIRYDTPYALVQHEDPTLNHPRQGEDHWLEKTIDENWPEYAEYIGREMRKRL